MILIAGTAGVFGFFVLLWFLGVIVGGQMGVFDRPAIRPIADERILTNIREEINKRPLLDAVQHPEDGRIYISQKGGTVHSFYPATGLWNSEQPFSDKELLVSDIVMLRAGKGGDAGSLWGLSAGGGLVRRFDGRWHTVIGDTLFTGPRNTPVQKDQLTAAAVSPDREWLVVGTIDDGIGIYNLRLHRWVAVPVLPDGTMPPRGVTHAVWWQNRFWIGGPSGLVSLGIENRTPRFYVRPALSGSIVDIDVDLRDRLWVLEKRNCREGSGCIRLSRFQNPQAPLERLIDETGIYPDLTIGDLFYGQYWDNRFMAAGQRGVFSYDTRFHSWTRYYNGIVLSTLPLTKSFDQTFPKGGGAPTLNVWPPAGPQTGFYFGFTGGIGSLTPDSYDAWILPDTTARIHKLRFGRREGEEILGISETGKVFAASKGKTAAVFDPGNTLLNPSDFHSAFNFGNIVLFVGEKGALVHDIVMRTYKDIPSGSLPEWLLTPGLQLLTSGEDTYIASPKDGNIMIYQVPTSIVTGGQVRAVRLLDTIYNSIGPLRDWGGQGMVVIIGENDRRVLRFNPLEEVLIGGDISGVPSDLLDVATYRDGLMAASPGGLRHYNYSKRTWTDFGDLPGGSTVTELTRFNESLLTVTADGRLLKWDEESRFKPLIGDQEGFDFTDAGLSDAKENDGLLYLAGNGTVYCYNPGMRQTPGQWKLPGSGRVTIIGFIRGEPLALCDGRATLGDRDIDPGAGTVINLSRDNDYLWTVREKDGERYLKRYPVTSPTLTGGETFFRHPGVGADVTEIRDALPLPLPGQADDRGKKRGKDKGKDQGKDTSGYEVIAALTDRGLRFYSPDARSWYGSYPSKGGMTGDRLYLIDGWLVTTGKEKKDYGIAVVKLDTVTIPEGTANRPVVFESTPYHIPVTAFIVETEKKRIDYIDDRGRFMAWKSGISTEILLTPTTAPIIEKLRNVEARMRNGGTGAPTDRRILVDNDTWTWEKQGENVSIRLKGSSYNFRVETGKSGFGFSSDLLIDAVVYKNRLYVKTGAFLEVVEPSASFGSLRARRSSSPPAAALEVVNDAEGYSGLFLRHPSGNSYLDETAGEFKPATGENGPDRERLIARLPARNPFLRFHRRRGGRIEKEVRVKDPKGEETWVSFDFVNRRFPFDLVTSAAVDSGRLFVGTAAGLLIYDAAAGLKTGLAQTELSDLRTGEAGPLQAVTRVGIPAPDMSKLIVRSRGRSIECDRGGGDFRPCPNPALLDERVRLENNFWRWVERGGTLDGRYKDETGKLSSGRISSRLGLFPHDRLQDIAVFDDRVFTLWEDDWVTVHPQLSTALIRGTVNYDMQKAGPRRFILIPGDIPPGLPGLPDVMLPRGIYLDSRAGLYLYRDGKWDTVTPSDAVTGIRGYADRPPVIHRDNLVLSSHDLTFKRLDREGKWHVVPWQDGRLTLDKWTDLFYVGDQLWAATAEGLVTFDRAADGRIVLNPDDFTVIREPGDDTILPDVTDVEVDHEHNTVTLRCEASSYQVYRGTFTAPLPTGQPIFEPLRSDPFAEKELVSETGSGFWEWRLKGRKDRASGWLEGRFRGEEIRIFDGRFDFDSINSLAFLEADRVEIAADGGGWYQAPVDGTMGVADILRPQVPDIDFTAVRGVRITGEGDRQLLGFLTGEDEYTRWRAGVKPQKTKGCPEFLANDGFRRYEKSEGKLVVTAAASKGGKALREIRDGRFTDDIVLGLPVTGGEVDRLSYFVPTEGGVLVFDKDLNVQEIHAGPFPGLQAEEAPSVLFAASVGEVLYRSSDGFRHLTGSRDPFPALTFPVPADATVTAVEEGPQGYTRALWKVPEGNRRGWSLSRIGDAGDSGSNTFHVNIGEFGKYIKNRTRWGNPGPWMQILLKPDRLEVFRPGSSGAYEFLFPETVDLISPVVVGETLYLIGERTLYEIDLERIMTASHDGAPSSWND